MISNKEELQSRFFKFVQHNQLTQVEAIFKEIRGDEELISNGQIVNSFVLKKSGDTGLHICARGGSDYLPIFKYLIEEKGANIEQTNHEGKTALHDAAQFSNLELVRYLINRGANVNVVKKADWTPLMLACTKQNVEVIRLLVKAGADPFFVNKDGWNCVHIAAREGNVEIVQLLLDSVLEPEKRKKLVQAKSRNGRKPLHTAVMHGHLEVTQKLIELSSQEEIHQEDNCGTTPLMDACRFGFPLLIHRLLQHEERESQVQFLLQTNKQGQTCLHIASEAGKTEVVEELVEEFGMDVNLAAENCGKMTALHWAAKEGHIGTMRALLRYSAKLFAEDVKGRTPLDLAETFGHAKVRTSLFHRCRDESQIRFVNEIDPSSQGFYY